MEVFSAEFFKGIFVFLKGAYLFVHLFDFTLISLDEALLPVELRASLHPVHDAAFGEENNPEKGQYGYDNGKREEIIVVLPFEPGPSVLILFQISWFYFCEFSKFVGQTKTKFNQIIMKPTLLVLAAGMGSRYGGLKQMDGLGPNGETIIDYSIHDAVEAGFGKVVYIVREYFKADMEAAVKEKYAGVKAIDGKPLEFVFVTQELDKIPAGFTLNPERVKPWGTAHAVLMAKDVIHEPFAVINGDDFYGKESFKILGDWCRAHENTKGEYCIIGFELENTLSENGSVSRGICRYDEKGILLDVTEHLDIAKAADGKVYGENSVTGEKVELAAKALCSMNRWGFTPDYFSLSEDSFVGFLQENIGQLKKEFYIPFAVDCIVKGGNGKCEVLGTPSKWFGVTYKEDRPGVVAKFAELVEKGVYPSPLYK